MVQLSFVLELPPCARAREAAKRFAEMHGLAEPLVATMEACAEGYSFFVVYGHSRHAVDVARSTCPRCAPRRSRARRSSSASQTRLGRKIVVVGACTGSDAHTVGIDAILNYKGYAGDKGLESYKGFEATTSARRSRTRRSRRAPAPLKRRRHPRQPGHHAAQLPQGERPRARRARSSARDGGDDVILLFGGPRVDHKLALELGFDAGFGPGTKPGDVASYLVERLCAWTALRRARSPRARDHGQVHGPVGRGAPAVLDHVLDVAVTGPAVVARAAGRVTACTVFAPASMADLTSLLRDRATNADVHPEPRA